MVLLYPTCVRRHVADITPRLLKSWGVSVVALDLDNTLAPPDSPSLDGRALAWVQAMRREGLRLVLLSNNTKARVEPVAQEMGIGCVSGAMKPLTGGFREVARRAGVRPEEMVIVGDQLFTDVLGANLFGCKSILVQPLEKEDFWGFKLRRRLERKILENYRNRSGGKGEETP